MTTLPLLTADSSIGPLLALLADQIEGDVRADAVTRGVHATDASHYQIVPAAVVWPRTENDLLRTLTLADQHGVPVTLRGAATSLSGQTHGRGLVVDTSRYLDRILEIDAEARTARVEPGVVLSTLNQHLLADGLQFAPDPATATRATIGGMIGNNSSGARSIRFGKTSDHVLAMRVALIDGTVLDLRRHTAESWSEQCKKPGRGGELYRLVERISRDQATEIRARYPKVMRRVAGYALDALLPEVPERGLIDLVIGSEGTLAVLLEATLNLVERPPQTALCVVHFDDVIESLRHLPRMLEFDPLAIEMLDDVILSEARNNPATRRGADFFVGEPKALQIAEFDGVTRDEARQRAEQFAAALEREAIGTARPVIVDPEKQQGVWETRRLGLGLISNVKGPRKGQAFIEDACVPVEHLAAYIEHVLDVCRHEGVSASIYGHASVGVLHSRPMLDLHDPGDIARMRRIAESCFERVREYGGSWSGEHGDGLVRGEFLELAFGERLLDCFREIKGAFDPRGLLNPGKLVDAEPMDRNLRYQQPDYASNSAAAEQLSSFRYESQGGFALAVEQCNGVGACRKLGAGTMCPSYMALRDEAHSTRGRANALRLAMSGQLGPPAAALASDELHEVLELCLSCKACKSECPNAVDMARLKADALQMRWRSQRPPLGVRLIGALPELASLTSGPQALLVNAVQRSALFRHTVQTWLGLDPARRLPAFASRPLGRLLEPGLTETEDPSLVLYADTYSRYYEPEVALAAVALLEQLGERVRVALVGDSQRPRLSKGLLDAARSSGRRVFERLDAMTRDLSPDVPILCLEPSCASALADDLPDLLTEDPLVERVAERVSLFDRFLLRHQDRLTGRAPALFWHQHCHERAVFDAALPAAVGATRVIESGAGCCGMAGSFGYEHAALSEQVARDRLLPNLERARSEHGDDLLVVANGFSCRHQIRDLAGGRTGVQPTVVHLAQAVTIV